MQLSQDIITKLNFHLNNALPGWEAQKQMSSVRSGAESIFGSTAQRAIDSSVLLFLYPRNKKTHLVFIKRAAYKGVHSQQISFPGGRNESTDSSLLDTAIRESQEEIGLKPKDLTILGKLTELYIPPSNFMVYPFVGYSNTVPRFKADPIEVDSILEFSLDDLLKPENKQESYFDIPGRKHISARCFNISGSIIWGATAMILNEFLYVLKKAIRES